jgi:hypothetical protein
VKPSLAAAVALALCACNGPHEIAGTQLQMTFTRPSFWDAPFPSDDRFAGGKIDLHGFDTHQSAVLAQAVRLSLASDGFAVSGGIFFTATASLDGGALPQLGATTAPKSPVQLIELDGPEPGRRYPMEVSYCDTCSPFGAPRMLALLPLQGVPLHEGGRYAAIVMRALGDAANQPLGVSESMAQLEGNATPDGLSADVATEYHDALHALQGFGVSTPDLAAMTVFTTGHPTAQLGVFRDDILARPAPSVNAPLALTDVFDDFCVYHSTIDVPEYQAGMTPFTSEGGAWAVDDAGVPQVQHIETANVYVTIPRSAMPDAGYPVVYFINTGSGGERGLVDRGPQATNGGPYIDAGTGPALHFARAGYAGVSVDGPLEGPRNTTGMNEDFIIFNLTNFVAMRDNLRQSAIEVILHAQLIGAGAYVPDVSGCPGATGPVRFDTAHLGVMGHSLGASILPLAAGWEPKYGALILSGSGGSWIENLIYKQQPLAVKPFAELLLNESAGSLTAFDPAVTIAQWAGEPADSQLYGRRLITDLATGAAPRHVLMEQGIVDHYILPRIANVTSLSVGLDLAGTALDDDPEYVDQLRVLDVLPLVSHGHVDYPVKGNVHGTTAVVVQHRGDGIEDGHEVVFQTDPPKHQYRCFLASWLEGTPSVLADDVADAPCR